jgi:inosose dehydratase
MKDATMFDKAQVRVGAVPNAWSNDDLPELGGETPFEQCLSEMALAGYAGTEMGSKYPQDTAVLKDALELRGLAASGAWFSTFFSAEGAEQQTFDRFRQTVPFYKALGIQHVYAAEVGHSSHLQPIPVFANRPTFSDDVWKRMIVGLQRLGEMASAEGLRIVYHHHTGTGVQSQWDVERLMNDTKPELLWLCLDTAHLAVGGGDPLTIAQKFAQRICHVHLKSVRARVLEDMRETGMSFWDGLRQGIFTVPGDPEGMLDFAPILQTLSDADFEGWLVVEAEQDPAKANPLKYFKTAREYLRQTAGI